MTIQEIEQKLNECQKALAELKESKKENSGKWKPNFMDEYWIRDEYGKVGPTRWDDDKIDNWRYNNIPIFKTEEECERYWHFMDTVKEKSYEFSKEEWENNNISKYMVYYCYRLKRFEIGNLLSCKFLGQKYFKTEEDAQYIIDNFKDELMEYFL